MPLEPPFSRYSTIRSFGLDRRVLPLYYIGTCVKRPYFSWTEKAIDDIACELLEGTSSSIVARRRGMKASTMRVALLRHGLPIRKIKEYLKAKIRKEWREGADEADLIKRYGLTRETLRKYLVDYQTAGKI